MSFDSSNEHRKMSYLDDQRKRRLSHLDQSKLNWAKKKINTENKITSNYQKVSTISNLLNCVSDTSKDNVITQNKTHYVPILPNTNRRSIDIPAPVRRPSLGRPPGTLMSNNRNQTGNSNQSTSRKLSINDSQAAAAAFDKMLQASSILESTSAPQTSNTLKRTSVDVSSNNKMLSFDQYSNRNCFIDSVEKYNTNIVKQSQEVIGRPHIITVDLNLNRGMQDSEFRHMTPKYKNHDRTQHQLQHNIRDNEHCNNNNNKASKQLNNEVDNKSKGNLRYLLN